MKTKHLSLRVCVRLRMWVWLCVCVCVCVRYAPCVCSRTLKNTRINYRMTLVSKGLKMPLDKTEEWYGTPYAEVDIPAEIVEVCFSFLDLFCFFRLALTRRWTHRRAHANAYTFAHTQIYPHIELCSCTCTLAPKRSSTHSDAHTSTRPHTQHAHAHTHSHAHTFP